MAKKKIYDEHSIRSLDDRSHVRLRPAMYIGDTGISGLHHMVYEVVDNSIDEITNGHGDLITCIIFEDGYISIEDNGRGIPIGNKKGISAVQVVMTSLRSGGKFDNDGYKTSSGLHGIGVSAVNFLSNRLELIIYREGYEWHQSYKKGKVETEVIKGESTKKTGTYIKFKPDNTIFQTIEFQYKILHDRLRELSYLNKGLRIKLIDKRSNKEDEFYSEDGITALVADINSEKDCQCPIIYFNKAIDVSGKNVEYNIDIEIAFQYNQDFSDSIFTFANNVNTRDGGSHLTGFKSGLYEVIIAYTEKKKMFKNLKIRPTQKDILEGLVAVISVKLPNPEFEGQTKSTLGNPEIKNAVRDQVIKTLTALFSKNNEIADVICEKVSQACIAREEAKKARDTVRRKNILSSTSLPGKLADCSEKNPDLCELFIVEGDCFHKNTRLYAKDGLKNIIDIEEGEMVYTHMHRYRPAIKRKPKIKRKKCKITIQGITFICSEDHLWGVLRANDKVCEWVQAKELKLTDLIIKMILVDDQDCKTIDILDFIKGRGIKH